MAFAERLFIPSTQNRSKLHLRWDMMAPDGVEHATAPLSPGQAHGPFAKATRSALAIPCPDPTDEDRDRDIHRNLGLKLARQEDWKGLSRRIAIAEENKSKTTGGMPVAELLAFGARADVVAAAKHTLFTGTPDTCSPFILGVEALEEVLGEHPSDPAIAAIVAKAYIDIGSARRGAVWGIEGPQENRKAFQAHFDRAAQIVAAVDDRHAGSSLIASARCGLNAINASPSRTIVKAYACWISSDPGNTQALRAMGSHLLPRWRGSYEQLEIEARRTAGRTYDIWGTGAYTWVMLDAIAADPEACARLDLDYFLDGLSDIVRRCADQHTINLLASYCAITMGAIPTGHDGADYVRVQIARAAEGIVKEHLTELHPMLWAHAARGFDTALRVRCPDRFAASGCADAMRYLTDLFRRELAAGQQITFTDQGVVTRST